MSRIVPFGRRPAEIEWVGGRYSLPRQVRDGDAAFQPEVIFWLELPSGLMLASTLSDPRSPLSLAESLEQTMRHPGEGPPRRPSRIRVAGKGIADELREAAAGIPIVVAPVPELDEAFQGLTAHLAATTPEPSYLGGGTIAPQLVEELFKAARLLFRAAPWRHLSDQQIVGVDIPRFGIEGACLSIIGGAGESFGLMLFSSADDYYSFIMPVGESDDDRLSLRSLSLDSREELPPSFLREIELHRWPVAGPKGYPVVLCITADRNPLPVTEDDVRILTALTRAFVAFFARHREVFLSPDVTPVRESSQGEDGVTVTLTAPRPDFDDDLFELEEDPFEADNPYIFDDDLFESAPPPMPSAGRNDPCPCGSGKKYKKCHLDADEASRHGGQTTIEPRREHSTEEQALVRQVKEEHYRRWLDEPVPALGNQTPRAAARKAKSRRELDLLLRNLENMENSLPEGERIDVGRLRRELGLEA